MRKENKSKLILLNASPIGDHVVLLDLAERFYLSEGIETVMFIKHNYKFLSELSLGYKDFIKCIDFNTFYGKFYFVYMFLKSIFIRNYLIYFLPIQHKKYLILIGEMFNRFTRCIVVSQEYKSREKYIPSGIHIKASINDKYYFEQSNNILKTLGFKEINSIPDFKFIKDESVKEKFGLNKKYLVIHPTPSHPERRVSSDKWNEVFNYAKENNYLIAFTGIKKDEDYIDELSKDLDSGSFVKIINVKAQDLVNVFYFAEELFMVHTGPTHIATALHKKMVVFCNLWLKQFDMSYNENAKVEILSKIDIIDDKAVEI